MSVEQGVSEIVDGVPGWEGVSVSSHHFGGREFNLGNVVIGHIHRSGMVDIPLPHDPDTQKR
jgi:hypothetical protein